MNEVLGEAYELVEDGLLGEDGFRDFTFANAVRLHGGMNARFFEGTVVEDEARRSWGSDPRMTALLRGRSTLTAVAAYEVGKDRGYFLAGRHHYRVG